MGKEDSQQITILISFCDNLNGFSCRLVGYREAPSSMHCRPALDFYQRPRYQAQRRFNLKLSNHHQKNAQLILSPLGRRYADTRQSMKWLE